MRKQTQKGGDAVSTEVGSETMRKLCSELVGCHLDLLKTLTVSVLQAKKPKGEIRGCLGASFIWGSLEWYKLQSIPIECSIRGMLCWEA